MKIVRVTSTFVPPWKGLGPGPYELSNAQSKIGHDIVVITKHTQDCEKLDKKLPYRVIRIKSSFDLLFSLKAAFVMFKVKKEFKYDIIHNHGFSGLFTLLFKKLHLFNKPIVSSVHIVRAGQFFNVNRVNFSKNDWKNNNDILNKYLAYKKEFRRTLFFEKIYFKWSDYLCTVSDSLTEEISYFYKNHAPITPVYNGVNEDTFLTSKSQLKPKKIEEKKVFNFIFVGVLNARKGEFDLIEALKKVNDNRVYVKIIGQGPARDRLSDLITSYGLEKNVSLIKNVPHSDLVNFLTEADVFVLPSYSEGLPKVLLEAMYADNIILVSDIKPHKSVINDDLGVLFKTGDPDDLAQKIRLIITNYQTYSSLAKQSKTHVLQYYTWVKVANRIDEVYHKLLK